MIIFGVLCQSAPDFLHFTSMLLSLLLLLLLLLLLSPFLFIDPCCMSFSAFCAVWSGFSGSTIIEPFIFVVASGWFQEKPCLFVQDSYIFIVHSSCNPCTFLSVQTKFMPNLPILCMDNQECTTNATRTF